MDPRLLGDCMSRDAPHTSLPGEHRELVPPDPIPNSVVKRFIADGSVGFPHVRVGHRQALIPKSRSSSSYGIFFVSEFASAMALNLRSCPIKRGRLSPGFNSRTPVARAAGVFLCLSFPRQTVIPTAHRRSHESGNPGGSPITRG
jgi:hypothetical protein